MMGQNALENPRPCQQAFDRAAEDLGNAIHLEHFNVQVPDQRWPRCSMSQPRADPRSLPDGVDTTCGSMSPKPVSSAGRQAAGAARPHGNRDLGREALLGRLASVAKKLDGTKSHSASTMTMRGDMSRAIACAAMNRMPRALGASRSAFPMSNSTCRSDREKPLAFYLRDHGKSRPTE